MQAEDNQKSLMHIRREIDDVDRDIINLLRKRMILALETKKFKSNIIDSDRERQVLNNIKDMSDPLLTESFLLSIYEQIIKESRAVQNRMVKLAGFQGEWGAYGETACHMYNPEIVPIPCNEFEDVFQGVLDGEFQYGIVPIENSLEGIITPVSSLIVQKEIYVIGEIIMPIHHSLLSIKGSNIEDIKEVYSHPQALGQCRDYLRKNGFRTRNYYDTAGAAAMIARERIPGAAAIANASCSKLYGLEILDQNIEDSPTNSTRFLVISNEKNFDGDKCMITFSTKDKVGALSSVLLIFKEYGINLSLIESIPLRIKPGEIWFLVEFWGNEYEENVRDALQNIREIVSNLRVVGNYKRWKE